MGGLQIPSSLVSHEMTNGDGARDGCGYPDPAPPLDSRRVNYICNVMESITQPYPGGTYSPPPDFSLSYTNLIPWLTVTGEVSLHSKFAAAFHMSYFALWFLQER